MKPPEDMEQPEITITDSLVKPPLSTLTLNGCGFQPREMGVQQKTATEFAGSGIQSKYLRISNSNVRVLHMRNRWHGDYFSSHAQMNFPDFPMPAILRINNYIKNGDSIMIRCTDPEAEIAITHRNLPALKVNP
jgi:hypothetical protein